MSKEFKQKVLGLRDGGKIYVEFYASWCVPCKEYAKTLSKLIDGGIPVFKVNVEEHMDLAQAYEIMSIPVTILFKNGDPVRQFNGVQGFDKLKNAFDGA